MMMIKTAVNRYTQNEKTNIIHKGKKKEHYENNQKRIYRKN